MTALPLRLGRLEAADHKVFRSGMRWLCPDGHVSRPNEIVAYCNIGLAGSQSAFGEEFYDFQVGLAPKLAGRIRHAPGSSEGGYLDRLPRILWDEDTPWATLEGLPADLPAGDSETELLFLAGRRPTGIAENRAGILSGWHDRARAWWGEQGHRTLLAVGICEMDAIFRGDHGFFSDLFEAVPYPYQIALTQNEPLISCSAVLSEQLSRTPAQMAAIRDDIGRALLSGPSLPSPEEWLFVGALLGGLERCPLSEDYEILSRSGLSRSGPATAVCLSLAAERSKLLRHRKHGYALNVHTFRLDRAGPAVRAWLRADFEVTRRSVADVAADYRGLVAAAPDRTFLVVNRFSSQHYEVIQSYHGLDNGVIASLSALRAKDLNLMLTDLAKELPNLKIVDADAIAADLGMAKHVPDGIHGSGLFYSEVRGELLRLIGESTIPDRAVRALSQS